MTEPAVHLDLDDLADHLAGQVDASAHLSGCDGCTARLAELAAADRPVLRSLRGLTDPPLPDHVADRVAEMLATQTAPGAGTAPAAESGPEPDGPRPAEVVPLAGRRRPRPRWAAVAAGVVLVAGGLLAAQTLTRPDGAPPSSSAPEAAAGAARDSAARAVPTVATGLDYADQSSVTAALAGVLDGSAGAATTRRAPAGALPDPLARLHEPAALAGCLAALLDPRLPDRRPLALDYATYRGSPSLAVLLPDPDPTRVTVLLVGPDCSRAQEDLRSSTRISRP